MKTIELTEDEKVILARCLAEGTEPPPELANKLFPSQFTHDFKTLHDARIPTIEYAGKRPEAAILSEASVMGAACPLQIFGAFNHINAITWQTHPNVNKNSHIGLPKGAPVSCLECIGSCSDY